MFDRDTPDQWHDLLGDLPYQDTREATRAICKRQPYCAPSDIRAEVQRIRDGRIARFGDRVWDYVTAAPDDPEAQQREVYALRVRIGDGEELGQPPTAQVAELRDRRADLRLLLDEAAESVGFPVDEADQ